jgi:polyhydroxybutyrate depolymerase
MSALAFGLVICSPRVSRADCDPNLPAPPFCLGPTTCVTPCDPNPNLAPNCNSAGEYEGKITYAFSAEAGATRDFYVYKPAGVGPFPVVIVYHGGDPSCSAWCKIMLDSHMKDVAIANHFILVFPAGHHPLTTNPAGCCHGWGWKYNDDVDSDLVNDVQFTRELIQYLKGNLCKVDDSRIYATGLSQGGFLSYRLACQLSDWITAVAPIAAADTLSFEPHLPNGGPPAPPASACTPSAVELKDDCHPLRAVPILHLHGTADSAVAYSTQAAGAAQLCETWVGAPNSTGMNSTATDIHGWFVHNHCDPHFLASQVYLCGGGGIELNCNVAPQVDYPVSCLEAGSCVTGGAVQLCTVTGGQHNWPGNPDAPGNPTCPGPGCPQEGSPPVTQNINASAWMADFFHRFARPSTLVPVTWSTTGPVSVVLNRLVKTDNNGMWNAANSQQRIDQGSGKALEFMASETTTVRRIGLDPGIGLDPIPAHIDFSFQLDTSGVLTVYEGGTPHTPPGGGSWHYLRGDRLRMDINSAGFMEFMQNGSPLYVSVGTPVNYPLYVHAALYSLSSTLDGVVLNSAPATLQGEVDQVATSDEGDEATQ